jgi:RNAse (barnase) inhibitor barstar
MNAHVTHAQLSDENVSGIAALAAALDWPCYVVDLAGCAEKPALLQSIADTMMFPSWFGHNWDAFFDCLVDLAAARRARGCVIVLRNAAEMRAHAPEALDTALGILEDAGTVWERRGVAMRTLIDVEVPAPPAQP